MFDDIEWLWTYSSEPDVKNNTKNLNVQMASSGKKINNISTNNKYFLNNGDICCGAADLCKQQPNLARFKVKTR